MNERDMLDLLHRRYGQRSYNGGVDAPRYICAEHVRDKAGFERRTLDFIAVDTWESSMRQGWLTVHGIEVKVSRSDWLRELRDPDKAATGMRYASHRWLAIPDESMVREGELPPGWGLMCAAGIRGLVARRPATGRQPEPLDPSAVAALLRAVAKTAAGRERQADETDRQSRLFPAAPDAEPDDGALFGTEEAS